MNNFHFQLGTNPGFILACILIAAGVTYYFYHKQGIWSKAVHYILAGLRFLLVFLVCFLFLDPSIQTIKNTIEKPILAILVDNSSSVGLVKDSAYHKQIIEQVKSVKIELQEADIDVLTFDLSGKKDLDEVDFDGDVTNISAGLSGITSAYQSRNLAGVLLVSDGIYNRGLSPEYVNEQVPIFTLGLGDTTVHKDILIHSVKANKTAFIENKFPVKVVLKQRGFNKRKVNVSLKKGDTIVVEKKVQLKKAGVQEVIFYLEEDVLGMQKYQLHVTPLEGEITGENNTRNVYVEIVDYKEKVLVYASAPHPDVKLMKKILEQREKYQVDIYIESISKRKITPEAYNLIVLHQFPAKSSQGIYLEKVIASKVPLLFIIGANTDIKRFNNVNKTLKINVRGGVQTDEVMGAYNSTFDAFQLDGNYISNLLNKMAPLEVPFGEYKFATNAQVLLHQRVGSVVTDRPLVLVQQNGEIKEAVIVGEGYWRWSMIEYAENSEQRMMTDIFTKTVQYVLSKDDKRNFKFRTVKSEFYASEEVIFQIEALNSLREQIDNVSIHLDIYKEDTLKRSIDFKTGVDKKSYEMGRFAEGIYKYKSTAIVLGKKINVSGSFTVKKKQLEALNLTADHRVLNQLSSNNNGVFYRIENSASLSDELIAADFKQIIHSEEKTMPLKELWWYFVVLVLLATLEWSIRKAKGGY